MRFIAMILVVGASLTTFPMPAFQAHAQTQSNDKICMVRMTTGRQGGDHKVSIVVKKASQTSLEARGFRAVPCNGMETKRVKFTQDICEFAGIAPVDIQAEFKEKYGATPNELCQSAN